MRFTYFILSVIVSISLGGCIKNNPDPSWIEVKEWTLEANPDLELQEGQLTHNISQAWVYVDNEIIGVFEVPFKIPVLKSGSVNIKIYPAIRNNGINATKKIYPFLEVYELNTTLTQNEVLTINPTTKYKDNVQFTIEDFEDASDRVIDDPTSTAYIQHDNDPAIIQDFNGIAYGKVVLNNTSDSTWVAYTDFYGAGGAFLPRGEAVYLEIDYYNTNSVITGVLAVAPSETKANINVMLNAQIPSSVVWKKIYIDLQEIVSNSDPYAYFEHTFQAHIEDWATESFIIIDNIKVVRFQ